MKCYENRNKLNDQRDEKTLTEKKEGKILIQFNDAISTFQQLKTTANERPDTARSDV